MYNKISNPVIYCVKYIMLILTISMKIADIFGEKKKIGNQLVFFCETLFMKMKWELQTITVLFT